MIDTKPNPFKLTLKPAFISRFLEKMLGLSPLARHYQTMPEKLSGKEFLEYALQTLRVNVHFKYSQGQQAIPKEGPLLIVANHPLGGLEGVAITHELLKYRSDVKVLTNELLTRIPEFKELFIGVDVLSGDAQHKNLKGLRQANNHLKNGGALLLFPAGKVSAVSLKQRQIKDDAWNKMAGTLVKKHQANCLPLYVHGRNSRLFYFLGLIHPRLRTVMLAREMLNKQGKRLSVVVGELIKYNELSAIDDVKSVTNYLRLASELLSSERKVIENAAKPEHELQLQISEQEKAAVKQLSDYQLFRHKQFAVYCVPFQQLGIVRDTIGRARESTFRAVGEGTGKDIDIDQFDPNYLHLFAWDTEKDQMVGGYRVGMVDKIVSQNGIEGLYTRSLYKYDQRFLEKLGLALELGRSFITPQYQRHPAALDILWKGIGVIVRENPQYHKLFGAVSISSEYSELARAFISETMLTSFRAEQHYIDDVIPKIPLKVKGKVWTKEILTSLNNLSAISRLVGRCDPGKGVPVLLRQYIVMNGRFVTFSVNTGFNDALDGLIVADLRQTSEKYLTRYLGKEGYQTFTRYWDKESQKQDLKQVA